MVGQKKLLLAVPLSAALACLSPSSNAGDWKVTDDIGVSATYVDRSGDAGYSGTVFELSPRWVVRGRGGRVTADINYGLNLAAGTGGTNPESLTHDLLARGQVEAVKNIVFVGAEANARVIGDSSTAGRVDAINFDDGGQQVYTLRLIPEFRHRLGSYADIVSRNSLDYVNYSDNDDERQSRDSTSVEGNLVVRSGRRFGPLSWNIETNHERTEFDDRTDKRREYLVGAGYRFDSHWRANGNVGYEDNQVATDRSDTRGFVWDLGGTWTPNPRTQVNLSYGSRYFGDSWSGAVSHRTKRTQLGLDFSRSVTNRRTQQLVDSQFFLTDPNGDIITDPSTGAPLTNSVTQLEETDEDFLNTQLRGIVTVNGRRTTASMTGTVSRRDFEISSNEEDSYTLTLRLTRQLGGSYRATLGSRLEEVESDDNGDSDEYELSFSLAKQFSRRTSASLDLLYRDRNDPDDDFTEHRIGLSLRANLL